MKEFKKTDPKVSCFVKNYAGRKSVKVQPSTNCRISNYWDGGSKEDAHAYDLNAHTYIPFSQTQYTRQVQGNPFGLDIGTVEMQPGIAIVVRSVFCGKDMGYRIFLHPDDYEKF